MKFSISFLLLLCVLVTLSQCRLDNERNEKAARDAVEQQRRQQQEQQRIADGHRRIVLEQLRQQQAELDRRPPQFVC